MKFKKEDLIELADSGGNEKYWPDGFKVIHDVLDDHTRWSLRFALVFEFDGKFYATSYGRGATESQDERPFEYEPDEIECEEVFPVLEQHVVYKTAVRPEDESGAPQ